MLVDPIGVMGHDAAVAADPHRDALAAAQVAAPDRGEPGPAAHVDQDVALHHAVIHLDQVAEVGHAQLDQVLPVGRVVGADAAAGEPARPEAVDDVGRQNVVRRRVRRIDVLPGLAEVELVPGHLGVQPARDDHADVPLVHAGCPQLLEHDGNGVHAHAHPVIEDQRHLAGAVHLVSERRGAHRVPDRVPDRLRHVGERGGDPALVGVLDDDGIVGYVDLPGGLKAIINTTDLHAVLHLPLPTGCSSPAPGCRSKSHGAAGVTAVTEVRLRPDLAGGVSKSSPRPRRGLTHHRYGREPVQAARESDWQPRMRRSDGTDRLSETLAALRDEERW